MKLYYVDAAGGVPTIRSVPVVRETENYYHLAKNSMDRIRLARKDLQVIRPKMFISAHSAANAFLIEAEMLEESLKAQLKQVQLTKAQAHALIQEYA